MPLETIAAISTPPGEGGIGVIRISGQDAIPLAQRLFRRANGKKLTHPQSFRLYYGHIVVPDVEQAIDEVLLCVMRAPHSYTCEDVVEINGHGGPVPMKAILHLVCQAGARPARPGEFTERAFLNGRIDLTQAEAVLDTIRARTDAGLRAAQRHLHGDIGKLVGALRQRLVTLLASLEAAIDYSDDDLTFLTPQEIHRELTEIRDQVRALITSHQRGKLLREGAQAVIIGRPNTGKSSLLNILVGQDRAIVTDIPGTTRDVIEEHIDLGGIPLRIIDTAGIRHTDDQIERIGVQRSRESLSLADLVLFVIDRSQPLTEEDIALFHELGTRPAVVILNKSDLPLSVTRDEVHQYLPAPIIDFSAATRAGLSELERTVHEQLLGGTLGSESAILANIRQKTAADNAYQAIEQALTTLDQGGSEELLAVDVMSAASSLGEITGDDIREEVIQDLFSRFCVGK